MGGGGGQSLALRNALLREKWYFSASFMNHTLFTVLSSDDEQPAPVNLPLPSDINDGFPVSDNIFKFMRNVYEEA